MNGKPKTVAQLPADIKRVVFRRQFIRTGFMIFWYAALIYGVYHYVFAANRDMGKVPVANIIAMVFVLGVIPFMLFSFQKVLFERTFCGKITEVKTVGSWAGVVLVSRAVKAGSAAFARITVETEDGKKRVITLENADGRHNNYYSAGENITHFRYIDIPFNADCTAEKGLVCVVCGEYYEKIGRASCRERV